MKDSHQKVIRQAMDSHQAVIVKLSCSHQALIRQADGYSSGNHQAVIKQPSGSYQAVIMQSSCSHQVVIRRSSVSHQTFIKQSLNIRLLKQKLPKRDLNTDFSKLILKQVAVFHLNGMHSDRILSCQFVPLLMVCHKNA